MERRILAILVCVAVACAGCAMEAAPPSQDATPAPAAEESVITLPDSYGTQGRNHRAMRSVEGAFRNVSLLRKVDRFTLSELKAITKATRFAPMAVSGCDLEVLKIFVASGWAPVVSIRSPVGPKHVRAVIGYDDSTERVILVDPVNYTQAPLAKVKYADFSKQWVDPQKTCLLVLSKYIGEASIRIALKNYLSEERMKSIHIKTPRKS